MSAQELRKRWEEALARALRMDEPGAPAERDLEVAVGVPTRSQVRAGGETFHPFQERCY